VDRIGTVPNSVHGAEGARKRHQGAAGYPSVPLGESDDGTAVNPL
jgi:hypothetical protein